MAEFLVFRLDELGIALRASAVDRVVHAVEITPLPRAPAIVLGVVNVRGQVIPVVNLRQRFGLPARSIALSDRFVIARTSRRPLAVVTDSVDGVFDYAESGITRPAELLPGIEQVEGIIQRREGILFIHDLERFLSLDEAVTLDRAVAVREEGEDGADAS